MTFFQLQEIQLKDQQEEDLAAAIPNQVDCQASIWLHQWKSGRGTPQYAEADSSECGSQIVHSEYNIDEVSKQ